MPTDIFEQATPFLLASDCFVEGRVRLRRQVRGDQRKTLVESPPPVFNGGQREMKALRKFDVGIAENGLAQHPLLSPGETESRRCVDEYRRRDMTEVPGDVLARQAKEKGTLAERGQRFGPIPEIASVVRSYCVRTVYDGLRTHLIPKLLENGLNTIAAHIFDERELDPVFKRFAQLLGQGRFGIVEIQNIHAIAVVGAPDGRWEKEGRGASS